MVLLTIQTGVYVRMHMACARFPKRTRFAKFIKTTIPNCSLRQQLAQIASGLRLLLEGGTVRITAIHRVTQKLQMTDGGQHSLHLPVLLQNLLTNHLPSGVWYGFPHFAQKTPPSGINCTMYRLFLATGCGLLAVS